ncbi:MAG: PPOX class F420-dependent oxidoreductase [Nitrospinae bacterium]|nr:PPOX class F420-dependent oxidoreductase [Nitrospinota bacterium]
MALIPESHAGILDTKALLYLGTQNKDGSPQVSPVWFKTNGDIIEVNSAKDRLKDINMRARPKVSIAIVDPENAYRWVGIQGTVVEITENGAEEHIDALANKYLGVDSYPNRQAGQVRVIYRIRADKVFTMGA